MMNKTLKTKKLLAALTLILFASTLFQACDDESTSFIVLNITGQKTFEKNDSIQFTARVQVIGKEKLDTNISWSSSNTRVAEIDASGLMLALDTGTTEIKASLSNGKYAVAEVRISAQSAKKLDISENNLLLVEYGSDTSLVVQVMPASLLSIYPVEWSSDNMDVVTVDSISTDSLSTQVKLRPLKAGKATISMKIGKSSVSCAVTVGAKVRLAQEELYLTVNGRQAEIIATVNEKLMAEDEEIKWISTDESVLGVKLIKQVNGKTTAVLQPLNEGDVHLVVSAGKNADTCVVHVGATVSLSWKIDAYLTLRSITMDLNETMELPVFAAVTPDDNYYINKIQYGWSSSDPSIVETVSNQLDPSNPKSSVCTLKSGGKKGSCVITLTARGEEMKALITVRDRNDIEVESISLGNSEITIARDKFTVLSSTVLPIGVVATWPVVWSSSAPAIATVDEDGKITGITGGIAIITAQSKDKIATCKVIVTEEVNSILIDTDTRNVLMLGDKETWTATVNPLSASSVFPTSWTSSNPNVATVNSSGTVTAKALGTAIITAKASDKTNTRSIEVVPMEANVDFGTSIDNGEWYLSGNRLTLKIEEGDKVYDLIIRLTETQSSLKNGVYEIGNQIAEAQFIWNKTPQVRAIISTGTLDIQDGVNKDKAFVFDFTIELANKNITIKGAGELYEN